MIRRLLSLFLAFVTILSLLPTAAFAASSEEDALGEVDIYNGDYELGYLAINGTVRKQKYTYFLYESNDGSTKESPAYCVNPNQYGVPQTVGPGESIKYLAEEKASDPKVVGIISNGYPHRSLGELGLENKYQAFYATKMAFWCYLIPSWDISNLKVAPGLSGSELDIGNRILAAAKDIYKRGTTYNYMLTPRMTVTADKSTAYPVTIDGQAYLQQVFTVWSETWVYDYDVSVAFSDPDSVPEGTKIVDANNKEITAVTTKYTSDGYAGTFKVLYPAGSVEGQSGNVQFSLSAPVAQYAAMYAVCQEKDQYGDLQNYICDLDNKVQLDVAAVSSYADSGEPDPDETALKIVKLEEGTEIPLEGAVFSVYDLEGKKVGSFSTGPDGTVTIPLTLEGHYTVTEEIPPRYHLLPEETTQHADVAFHSSGVCRSMTGTPQIFCVFPEVNATETAIPSKQASCLPALLHPRGMGGAAHRPIDGNQPGPGWRTAGPDRQPDRGTPESPGGAVDGQESPLHSGLYRRLHHGPRVVERGAGPDAGGRGTRLCRLGLAPAGQRHGRPEGEQDPDPQCPPGAGYPQAPPIPECAGYRRQRRGQDPELRETQHPGGQYQLCGH